MTTNNYWMQQHIDAIENATVKGFADDSNPKKRYEQAIVLGLRSLRLFAEAHQQSCDTPIGNDGVLGNYWLNMASALKGMLNGEHGRLDAGTINKAIRDMAREFGFTKEESDQI